MNGWKRAVSQVSRGERSPTQGNNLISYRTREEESERKAREKKKRGEKEGVEVGVGTGGDAPGHKVSLVTARTGNIRAQP